MTIVLYWWQLCCINYNCTVLMTTVLFSWQLYCNDDNCTVLITHVLHWWQLYFIDYKCTALITIVLYCTVQLPILIIHTPLDNGYVHSCIVANMFPLSSYTEGLTKLSKSSPPRYIVYPADIIPYISWLKKTVQSYWVITFIYGNYKSSGFSHIYFF